MEPITLFDQFISVFTTNKYIYETDQTIEQLRNKLEFVINQKEIFRFKYNLCGELRADHSFKLVRRAGFGNIRSWDREPVTIMGKLIAQSPQVTEIEIEVKPNFIFVAFSFLLGMAGIVGGLFNLISQDYKDALLSSLTLVFVVILWGIAWYTKKFYKSEFEKALDLDKNELIVNRTVLF